MPGSDAGQSDGGPAVSVPDARPFCGWDPGSCAVRKRPSAGGVRAPRESACPPAARETAPAWPHLQTRKLTHREAEDLSEDTQLGRRPGLTGLTI